MTEPAQRLAAGSTALVTGASGFTGSVLVRRLVQMGVRVRAIARMTSRLDALADLDIEWVRGDVDDHNVVETGSEGVEYIFHLAAAYREARRSERTYHRVHVVSTQRLAAAAVRNRDFKRFVHISTIGVHGHVEHPPADEHAPFRPDDAYQRTKAEAERWIRNFAPAHGLPLTVLRPCAIYGPGDQRLLKLFKMVDRGFFPLLGRHTNLYHLIHVEDLVDAILLAAVHPAALNEIFIVGNPHWITLEQMAQVVAAALGRRVRIVRLPAWPFVFLAGACEVLCRPFDLEPPLHRRRVAFYTKDRAFDTTKLTERLGYRPRFSNEEGIAQTAAWYRAHAWLGGASPGLV